MAAWLPRRNLSITNFHPRTGTPGSGIFLRGSARHALVGADIIRPQDCAHRVCTALIAKPAIRMAPLKGELSAEPTERFKGCRFAERVRNSIPRKPLRHGLTAVPPPLSGEAWARREFGGAFLRRDGVIPPYGRNTHPRRGHGGRMLSAPTGLRRHVCTAPIAKPAIRMAPLQGELSAEPTERFKSCHLCRAHRKFDAAKTSPSRLTACHLPFQGRPGRGGNSAARSSGGMGSSRPTATIVTAPKICCLFTLPHSLKKRPPSRAGVFFFTLSPVSDPG